MLQQMGLHGSSHNSALKQGNEGALIRIYNFLGQGCV
jgi:hypothetical protein